MEADSKPTVNLFKALAAARAEMSAVQKGGANKFDDYSYSTMGDYAKVIDGPLERHGLILFESITQREGIDGRKTSKGTANACVVIVKGTLVHAESGESMEVESAGEGQHRADKATYIAITGARKYLRACLFNLVSTDDPEAQPDNNRQDKSKGKDKPPSASQTEEDMTAF